MQRRRQGAVLALALLAGVALSALLSVTTQLVVVPVDDPTVLAERSPLPPHWHASKDSTGKTYYWNRALGTSSWNPPNADGSNNDGSEAGGSSDDADSLADDAAEIEEADNQPEGARGGAAMDSWDAGSTSGKSSTLHGAVPQYQVTNSADDEADLNSPEDLSADAQGADASESSFADDQAQWDGDDTAQAAAARQSGWALADNHVDAGALDLSAPIQLHPIQSLAPNLPGPPGGAATAAPATVGADAAPTESEDAGGADQISDITGYPDWPSDLPGAYGDDTSWIVGQHREPFWSDSMTHACGLTTPCEKGRADKGHAFQKTVNPWTDKRRTFDPYAQAEEAGRNNYPWDPSRDPKYYGKADCGDGQLTDECFEKPTEDELKKKKEEWKRKYDEWFTGKVTGEGEEDSDGPEAVAGAQKKVAAANAALMTVPKEITPWARSEIPGIGRKAAKGHYAGGEPVAKSFGHFVNKVEGDLSLGMQALASPPHFKSLDDWEHKFFRARPERRPVLLSPARAQMLAEVAPTQQKKQTQQKKEGAALKPGSAAAAREEEKKGLVPAVKSIWESPLEVMKRGLFGAAAPKTGLVIDDASARDKAAAKKAAQTLAESVAKASGKKGRGPLPSVLEDAEKVTEGESKERVAKKQGKVDGWEEQVMQKSAMRRESAEQSMADALRARDHAMLQKADGLSWSKLKTLEDTAKDLEKDIAGESGAKKGAKKGKKAAAMTGWEEKEIQQGAMKHESVEANLREALGKRELGLLEHKAGWKSEGELNRALAFADNLEAAMKDRRSEEKTHPLMPKAAKKVLSNVGLGDEEDAQQERSEEHHAEMKAVVKEEKDRKVEERVREEAPMVEAYQAQVADDEQEYEGEMTEEKMTLAKLHRDQGKLTKAIEAEEGTGKRTSDDDMGGDKANDDDDKWAEKESAGLSSEEEEDGLMKLRAVKTVGAPKHGLSAAQAEKDIDSFFDSESAKQAKHH